MRFKFNIFIFLLINISIYSVKLPDGTDVSINKFDKYENGNIKSVSLSEPATLKTPIGLLTFFQSVSEFEGLEGNSTVEFHQNGTIKSGYLKDKTIIATKYGKIPVTYISFYEDGKINSLYTPLEYNMVTQGRDVYRVPKTPVYIATEYGNIPVDGTVEFYNSGVISKIGLGNNLSTELTFEKLGKIKLKSYIEFYENSKISSSEIEKTCLIQTEFGKLKAKNDVLFWNNGKIKSIDFEPQVIETPVGLLTVNSFKTYSTGNLEQFSSSGRNESISYNNQNYVLAYEYSTPNIISLYESGKLKSANINNENKSIVKTSIGDIIVSGKLKFYENGHLQYASNFYDGKVNTTVGTLNFNEIFFYETGTFEGGRLNGYKYKIDNLQSMGIYLKFDAEGNLTGIVDFDPQTESMVDNRNMNFDFPQSLILQLMEKNPDLFFKLADLGLKTNNSNELWQTAFHINNTLIYASLSKIDKIPQNIVKQAIKFGDNVLLNFFKSGYTITNEEIDWETLIDHNYIGSINFLVLAGFLPPVDIVLNSLLYSDEIFALISTGKENINKDLLGTKVVDYNVSGTGRSFERLLIEIVIDKGFIKNIMTLDEHYSIFKTETPEKVLSEYPGNDQRGRKILKYFAVKSGHKFDDKSIDYLFGDKGKRGYSIDGYNDFMTNNFNALCFLIAIKYDQAKIAEYIYNKDPSISSVSIFTYDEMSNRVKKYTLKDFVAKEYPWSSSSRLLTKKT